MKVEACLTESHIILKPRKLTFFVLLITALSYNIAVVNIHIIFAKFKARCLIP